MRLKQNIVVVTTLTAQGEMQMAVVSRPIRQPLTSLKFKAKGSGKFSRKSSILTGIGVCAMF